ncbi:hypothetical protein BpHYR1_002422 [Brachionus plicatilis]|uniref:Transmembrane protein n=1 Tax=Brachionus plicatilis TaxID=10195 RepID=A0A3M7PRX8_BRAPC|nr:hypothetical protein BpHYR1_002422 [Brachionus plicatilis]
MPLDINTLRLMKAINQILIYHSGQIFSFICIMFFSFWQLVLYLVKPKNFYSKLSKSVQIFLVALAKNVLQKFLYNLYLKYTKSINSKSQEDKQIQR